MGSESQQRPVGPIGSGGLSTRERDVFAAALPAYELGEQLGCGACGVVLAAHHRGLHRDVAIKVLAPRGGLDEQARLRFVAEARALASLDHPHVVTIHDFVEADGMCMLIMERVTGGTVKTRLASTGWSAPAACAVLLATCSALEHAHARGVLHRDIKPENLLVSAAGVVKVADFGIAKLLTANGSDVTHAGTVLGTPAYLAPELIEGATPTPAVDVYAAGTVLYELLCGMLPFPTLADAIAQLYQRVHEDPIPLLHRAPSLPAALSAVIARALQRDPQRRYPTPAEFATDIADTASSAWGEQWLQTTGINVQLSRPPATPPTDAPSQAALRFRVLGPLEVADGGRLLELGGQKQRAVLVALLLSANRVLAIDRLVDELWGEDPPAQATNALQTYVSKLRNVLEPGRRPRAPARILRSQPPGYLLCVNPADIDAALFEEFCGEGRALLKHGKPERARECLLSALALWRGPPLAEFANQPFARAEAARLEELRAVAREDRVAADLALGEHSAVIAELQQTVAEQPLRERLWEQLMLALYRAGRQGDALAAYQRCREALDEQLGVAPGPALRRLQGEILAHDPCLDWIPATTAAEQLVSSRPTLPAPPVRAPAEPEPLPPAAETPQADAEPAPPVPESTNLPVQRAPLLGRDRELSQVCDLLRRPEAGIVTLTGPGGVGKTRLALQVGTDLLGEFPDGVFLISLAALADPELVMPTIAQTLGVVWGLQTLGSHLSRKRVLVILDNMEQVVLAGPALAELLTQAPRLKLLVTSREALRVRAEQCYQVPPLQVPDPAALHDTGEALRHGAVELFAQRAGAVQPRFELTRENAATVAEICARLDGLPLAIELAAARIAVLSPAAILARLDQRFRLLAGGAADLPERHQALRTTIGWSHDLLARSEQRLFARLAVFAGGFALEDAEAVCDADLDELASLVNKSLVRIDDERFDLLESIRAFALEQLGDDDTVHERHADHYLRLAEATHPERWRHEHEHAPRLEREHDNFRAALAWLQDREPERHARLASALAWLWHVHSHFGEGRERLRRALDDQPPRGPVLARLLAAAGELDAWSGNSDGAVALLQRAAALWRDLGERQELVYTLQDLGWAHFFAGEAEQAHTCMNDSLALQRQVGDDYLVNRAQTLVLQALISLGDVDTVERLGQEALVLGLRLGDRRSVQYAQHFLADCPLIRGDCATAQDRYLTALATAREIGDRIKMAAEVQGLGMAAAGLDRPRRALILGGGATAEMDLLGIDLSTMRFWTALLDRYLGNAREQLGPVAAAAAWHEGQQMEFARVLEYAGNLAAG
jgi:predicted ATPase/DNA-binding SARP family transcriptional activator